MSFSLPKYLSSHEHKMDAKFRVSIPSAWRPEEGEELILMDATVLSVPMIRVLTNAAAEEAIYAMKNSGATPGEIRDAIGYFYSSIQTVKVSSQGKILIPKDWSLRANITAESNVVLVGHGDYFEIFNATDRPGVKTEIKDRVTKTMASIHFFST